MNSKGLGAVAAALLAVLAMAADKPGGSGVIQFGQDQVSSMFARGGTLLATNNFKVMALRRDAPGEVEIHARDTDIVYVLEGSAIFVTGGTATEPRTTGPGETRARRIDGGEERHLTKGEVIVVPNGVPHWFKEVSAPFLYYVVKVTQ